MPSPETLHVRILDLQHKLNLIEDEPRRSMQALLRESEKLSELTARLAERLGVPVVTRAEAEAAFIVEEAAEALLDDRAAEERAQQRRVNSERYWARYHRTKLEPNRLSERVRRLGKRLARHGFELAGIEELRAEYEVIERDLTLVLQYSRRQRAGENGTG